MSEAERQRWEKRYAEGDYVPRDYASPFLEEWLERLPPGSALDIACGAGRNALCLAEAGYKTDAIDISQTAIERARDEAERRRLTVNWRVADLDETKLSEGEYDVITVIRYVNRRLWPQLVAALRPGGALLIDHHLQTTARVDGPESSDFRLGPQELLEAFRGLRIVFYAETVGPADRSSSTFALARMVAFNGDPGF